MSLGIGIRSVDGEIAILDVQGKLMLGDASAHFRMKMRDLIAKNYKKFVLNFSELTYLDSSGAAELISASATLTRLGGEIVIASPTLKVGELFRVTKWNTFYKLFDSEDEAVSYLRGSKPSEVQTGLAGSRN